MAEAGALGEDEPVELSDGRLIVRADHGPPYGVPVGIPPPCLMERWPSPPHSPLRRFRVSEYHRMLDAGVFDPALRTELVEGWVIEKMTHNPRHDSTVQRIVHALGSRIGPKWCLPVQMAATMDDGEPEPDIAVVSGPVGRYDLRHPCPADIALIVEVADATLAYDRGVKLRQYARNYVRAVWIVNLIDRQVETFADPSGPTDSPGYGAPSIFLENQAVPLRLPGTRTARLAVRQLLARR